MEKDVARAMLRQIRSELIWIFVGVVFEGGGKGDVLLLVAVEMVMRRWSEEGEALGLGFQGVQGG